MISLCLLPVLLCLSSRFLLDLLQSAYCAFLVPLLLTRIACQYTRLTFSLSLPLLTL